MGLLNAGGVSVARVLFRMRDITNPESGLAGLAIGGGGGISVAISQDGGAFVSPTNTAIESAAKNGWYQVDTTVAERQCSTLIFEAHDVGAAALPYIEKYEVTDLSRPSMAVAGVDHNFSSTDFLRILDTNSAPISGVNVFAFRKDDWVNNRRSSQYQVDWIITDTDGRWLWSMLLPLDTYVIIVQSKDYSLKYPKEITVT